MPPLPTEKSEFVVECVKLGPLVKHPNADTLSIVQVDGYPCIVKNDTFKEGDLAVYIPVDSLVPTHREELPDFHFLAKPDRTHHRVRAIKLRGVFSMGLLI